MAKKRIPQKIVQIVNNYARRLSEEEKLPIERVIIFGSYANGKADKWSDIDVCILSSKFQKPMQTLGFLLQKRNNEEVSAGLEPIGFTRKDFNKGGVLIEEIKKTGVEL